MNWSRICGVYFRNLYNLVKGPFQLSDLFYWPLVDILLWGLTSVWIQKQNAEMPHLPLILLTGLVLWQITMRGSIDVSVGLLQEFWHRNLVNLFSTPLKISEWIAGIILLNLCKLVVTIAFGSLLVYFLYALNIFSLGWAFLPFAASLLLFGLCIGFIAASGIIYWGHQVETFAFMAAFLFAPFCAVFYPVAILPAWAQAVAWCLPPTYVFEGMRKILSTGTFPQSYFWISMILNLLYLFLTTSLFCFMFEKSRAKGLGRFE